MACGCTSACACTVLGEAPNVSVVRDGDAFTVSVDLFVQTVSDTSCVDLEVDIDGDLTAGLIISNDAEAIILECTPDGLLAGIVIDPASTAPVSVGASGLRVDCCAPEPSTDGFSPGDLKFSSSVTAQPSWLDADGQEVSRGAYSALHDETSIYALTANRISGVAQITGISSTRFIGAGMPAEATGFPFGTTVLSVDSSTAITLSNNATNSGADTELRIYPYGNGDGISTFNVIDMNRRFPLGYDYIGGGDQLGFQAGLEDVALVVAELAAHDHSVSVSSSQAPHDHTGVTGTVPAHSHGLNGGRSFVTLDPGFTNQTILEATSGAGDTFSIPVNVDPGAGDWEQQNNIATNNANNHNHAISSDTPVIASIVTESTVGSGTPHENMPPYNVGRWMVHI